MIRIDIELGPLKVLLTYGKAKNHQKLISTGRLPSGGISGVPYSTLDAKPKL